MPSDPKSPPSSLWPPWSDDPTFPRLRVTDDPPKPIEWGIKPYIDLHNLGLVIGPPGAGKTFLMLHAALCIASGKPFLGKFPTKQTRVAWLDCDGITAQPTANAISRLRRGLGIEPKDIEETFFAVPPTGWTIGTLKDTWVEGANKGEQMKVLIDAGKERLQNFIRNEKIDHTFIDVLSAIHTKDETNEGYRDVVRHALGGVVRTTDSGVTLLAHTRKGQAGERVVLKKLEDAKGGIELIGAPSIGIIVQRTLEDPSIGIIQMQKNRSVIVEEFDDVYFHMVKGDDDLSPVTFETCGPPEKIGKADALAETLEWLRDQPKESWSGPTKLSDRHLVDAAIRAGISTSKGTMTRARKAMERRGSD